MVTIDVVLLLVAFICFVLSAVKASAPRVELLPLGLALWVLSLLI